MLKVHVVPVTQFQQNCSIVWCEETMIGALVDPGGDVDAILAEVEKRGITLEKILLTHGHLDHAGGAQDLKEKLKLPIMGPEQSDKFWLDGIEEQAAKYGMTGLRCCLPDEWLEEGAEISVGNVVLETIHCPGHTPGHLVFYDEASRVAFVGDVLFAGSIGRTDFPQGNHEELISSITQKLWPLGDDVSFVPGHGPLSTFGRERKTNPFVADENFG